MKSIPKYRIHFCKRIVSSFLAVIMLIMSPLNSYASSTIPIASSSDSSVDFEESEIMEENIVTPYAESFKYCPETLESVLYSDSRFAITSSALLYVLTVILAACGIYVASQVDITSIFTSFETWLRTNYGDNANVMKTWQDVLGTTAGSALYSMSNFIPIFKKYLNGELSGYGTEVPEYTFSSSSVAITEVGKYPLTSSLTLDIAILTSPVYYYFFDLSVRTDGQHSIVRGPFSLGKFRVGLSNFANSDYLPFYSLCEHIDMSSVSVEKFKNNPYVIYSDEFSSVFEVKDYFKSPDFVLGESAVVSVTADKVWTDLQTKDDATNIIYGDSLTVPDTDEALQKILDALGIANTSKEVADALAPSLTITDTGTGESGGESGDASILGLLGSILTAVLALPIDIVKETISSISAIPLFNNILLNLDSLVSGVGDILSRVAQWDFADWSTVLGATLLLTLSKAFSNIGLDGVADVLLRISQWDFADWSKVLGATLLLTLSKAFADIGLDGIGDTLSHIAQWNFSDWSTALGATLLLALLDFASKIGLDGVAQTLISVRDGIISIPEILSNLYEYIKTIPSAIVLALANAFSFEPNESSNDGGFKNFLNIFMLLLFIVIMLIILFINCLRFIVFVFNIPPSTVLFNADVLSGVEFLKSIEIPLFGMSVYSLLLSAAYFVLFFSVIAMLRKKIDKFNL